MKTKEKGIFVARGVLTSLEFFDVKDYMDYDNFILLDQDNKASISNKKKEKTPKDIINGLNRVEYNSIYQTVYRNFAEKLMYSREIKATEKENFMKIIKDNENAREFFICLFLRGNKTKYLIEDHYNIISSAVLDLLKILQTEENIILAVKVIKGCFYIKKFQDKNDKALIDDICSKLKNINLISHGRFWDNWMKEESGPEDELDEEIELIYNQNYINLTLPDIMKKMGLEKEFMEETCKRLNEIYKDK